MPNDPHASRTPGAEDRQLDAIIGNWKVTGENAPSAPGSGPAAVDGEETFERMAGGFFVHGRFVRRFPGGEHSGLIVLGYDRDRRAVLSHNFDNLGYARTYTVAIDGATWRFTGEHERAAYVFDGNTYRASWEMSKDGRTWQPLCRLHGKRA